MKDAKERITDMERTRQRTASEMRFVFREAFRRKVIGLTVGEANAIDNVLCVYPAKVGMQPRLFASNMDGQDLCLRVGTVSDMIVETFDFGPRCEDINTSIAGRSKRARKK